MLSKPQSHQQMHLHQQQTLTETEGNLLKKLSTISQEKDMTELVEKLLTALENSNSTDDTVNNLKVSHKPEQNTLYEKIMDDELDNMILGDLSDEENSIMQRISEFKSNNSTILKNNANINGYDEDVEIDNEIMIKIRQDAKNTLLSLVANNMLLSSLLSSQESSDDFIHRLDALRISDDHHDLNTSAIADQYYNILNKNTDIPNIEEIHEKIDGLNENDESFEKSQGSGKGAEAEDERGVGMIPSPQDIFSSILKSSIDASESSAASLLSDEDLTSNTIQAAVGHGGTAAMGVMDIDSLIGSTMSLLAKELGINMTEEILNDPSSRAHMQGIVQEGYQELSKSIEELDRERERIMKKLTDLTEEVRGSEGMDGEDTEGMPASYLPPSKNQTIDLLLQSQDITNRDLLQGRYKLAESTMRLKEAMIEFENSVPPLTALALFPSKSMDKKAAFVLGLSLFMKVPFDLIRVLLFAPEVLDFSFVFSMVTQSLLCIALFHYYGLLGQWLATKRN